MSHSITPFATILRTNPTGNEFWSSRDFAKVLDYADYRNFQSVIESARTACFNSGQRVEDHFVEVTEMVEIGSGAQRQLKTVMTSRYACYLVIQNADPSKEIQPHRQHRTRRQPLPRHPGRGKTPSREDHRQGQGQQSPPGCRSQSPPDHQGTRRHHARGIALRGKRQEARSHGKEGTQETEIMNALLKHRNTVFPTDHCSLGTFHALHFSVSAFQLLPHPSIGEIAITQIRTLLSASGIRRLK